MTAKIIFRDGTEFPDPDIREIKRGRELLRITIAAAVQDAAAAFVDGAEYAYEFESAGHDGAELIREDLSGYSIAGEITDHRDGTVTVLMGKPTAEEEALDSLAAADAAMRAGVNGGEDREEPRICEAMRRYGREKAEALALQAADMTDTEVIAEADFIPEWRPGPQTAGAVVQRASLCQVYRVLQTHDSTGNDSWAPELAPALFGVCHTKDPSQARPWVQPYGTSGMYYKDECYLDEQGQVWRQIYDGSNVYDAVAMPTYWEQVEV